MKLRLRLIAVTSLCLFASAAAAQEAQPAPAPRGDANLEEAKVHFQQGVALFNDGNFNAALAEFQAAYRLRPSSGVLYNIGLTQKALFRYAESIESLEKYLAESQSLAPERRAEVTQLVVEMKALLADVTVRVEPAGAAILLDGRTVGTAPLAKPLGIAAGSHVLEVHADGHTPQRKELMITAGVPLSLEFKLQLIPKSGKVRISARPENALIKVDDQPQPSNPVELELKIGGHVLEIAAPKHVTHRSELVIAGGQVRTVDVQLEKPKKKVYEQWYFWAPISLVVAGGLGLGLGLGLTPEGPLPGTLQPGVGQVN
jgi:hypothetical protein